MTAIRNGDCAAEEVVPEKARPTGVNPASKRAAIIAAARFI